MAMFILSIETGFVGHLVFPQIPVFLFYNAGAVLALWLMSEIWWAHVGVLLVLYPIAMLGAKGDGMVSYNDANTWFMLSLIILLVQNVLVDSATRLICPTRLFLVDYKWNKPNEIAALKFNRKWFSTFRQFSLIMFMIHVGCIVAFLRSQKRIGFFGLWVRIMYEYTMSIQLAASS